MKFDPADVSTGYSGSVSGKGARKSSSRRAHLFHHPTGIRVECEPIPQDRYTNRQLLERTKIASAAAMPEMERRVKAHYKKLVQDQYKP